MNFLAYKASNATKKINQKIVYIQKMPVEILMKETQKAQLKRVNLSKMDNFTCIDVRVILADRANVASIRTQEFENTFFLLMVLPSFID